MPFQVADSSERIVTLTLSGLLTEQELVAAQLQLASIIDARGSVRVLVLTRDFEGWSPGDEWSDFALQARTDPFIEKMAIVGERRWEDLALLFVAQGMRPFPIEYFLPDELPRARDWLAMQ